MKETLTITEKVTALCCIRLQLKDYEIRLMRTESDYNKLDHYDEDYDKKIIDLKERIEFFENLVKKLETILEVR